MGGSILDSLGLSELITDSRENYVLRCKQFSEDEGFRKNIREIMSLRLRTDSPTEKGLFNGTLIKGMVQGA